ncbi:flagellar motor protein [Methylomagnum ishizawai]|uniref:flagellar motor protein n=1 Tax=Methylomagnum ishizawai TaxID=1760988 RepID=UPI001C32D61C|nr:flagellar motor protein [Methylomagnum ishizawai]BBL74726.1 flagellar motor protein [Methylomagnum ishizawai]
MDGLTIAGIFLGVGAVVFGNFLEGGHIGSLLNGPALVIVIGGTLGAVMLQTPPAVFVYALKMLRWVLFMPSIDPGEEIKKLVGWSTLARREGLLGLENFIPNEADLFSRKGLQLLVDGNEPEVIRDTLELELGVKQQRDLTAAKVFEAMGGYSPTIGIIGAVMGLIHVMQNLSEPAKLGSGIATAFVATIYGVGLANLLFIPVANKLKARASARHRARELVLEGVIAIAEGENPRNIELKLTGFLDG